MKNLLPARIEPTRTKYIALPASKHTYMPIRSHINELYINNTIDSTWSKNNLIDSLKEVYFARQNGWYVPPTLTTYRRTINAETCTYFCIKSVHFI